MAAETQMRQMMEQMQMLTAQMQAMAIENQTLHQAQAVAAQAADARERQLRQEMQELTGANATRTNATGSQGGGEGSALVSKWAPDQFSGQQDDWRMFSLKFRSYVGAMHKGTVGVWMDYAKENHDSN